MWACMELYKCCLCASLPMTPPCLICTTCVARDTHTHSIHCGICSVWIQLPGVHVRSLQPSVPCPLLQHNSLLAPLTCSVVTYTKSPSSLPLPWTSNLTAITEFSSCPCVDSTTRHASDLCIMSVINYGYANCGYIW